MIELVVFDMAGTTVKDDDAVRNAFRGVLLQQGIHANEDRITTVMGLPKPEAIGLLLVEAGQDASPERVDLIHKDFVKRMQDHYAHHPGVQEIPGTSAVFAQLRQAGIKVALNTGFSRDIVEVLLKRLGWQVALTPAGETSADRGLIDASVTSDEVPRGRPYPDMIQHLMQRLNIDDPRKVAKIGDTWVDLEEGTNAGCGMVIGVSTGSYTPQRLAQRPHTHILESVADLPALIVPRIG